LANPNTIADVINRQNNGQPLVLSPTTTFHGSFQLNGVAALLTIPNPMAPIDTPQLFPNFSPDGRPFLVRVAGKVLGGEKYQIDLVQGTGLVNVAASTGLATNGLASDNFLLEAEFMWDSQSQNLRCFYYGFVGNTSVNQAGVINSIQVVTAASLNFNCALTIPTANATAVVNLTEFSAEVV
jgi:hypothetical protein